MDSPAQAPSPAQVDLPSSPRQLVIQWIPPAELPWPHSCREKSPPVAVGHHPPPTRRDSNLGHTYDAQWTARIGVASSCRAVQDPVRPSLATERNGGARGREDARELSTPPRAGSGLHYPLFLCPVQPRPPFFSAAYYYAFWQLQQQHLIGLLLDSVSCYWEVPHLKVGSSSSAFCSFWLGSALAGWFGCLAATFLLCACYFCTCGAGTWGWEYPS